MTYPRTPRSTTGIAGAPCWIELLTRDVAGARAFYGGLFGWTGEDLPAAFGGYSRFRQSDGSPAAGCMPITPRMTPDEAGWSVYLGTNDAAATTTAATTAGATVEQGAYGIADLGTAAFLTDPGRAPVGLWQTGSFAGFGSAGFGAPHGAPVYFELLTAHYAESVAFYRDVLGWDAVARDTVPGIAYTTLGSGEWPGADGPLAGIMDAAQFLGDGEAASWTIYFGVSDVDRSARDVVRLGGTVVMEAVDTPFGRQALVADPDGSRFKLYGPNAG